MLIFLSKYLDRSRYRAAIRTTTAFAILAAPIVTVAQTPPPESTTLEPVMVTATKVEAPVNSVPVSVVVIGDDDLQSQGVRQVNDLAGLVGGVTVPNGYSNMPQAVGIRGVGVSVPAMSQAVGIYMDDVPLIRGYATALWDLPDIQRIEVLRGPQGTLYGQDTTGGAIRYVSLDPTAQYSGWLEGGFGNYDAREARGYVTGTLGDEGLLGSIAFSTRSNDGFGYDATTGDRVNKLNAAQFRAKLRWVGAPGLDIVLSIDGLQDRSDVNTLDYPLNHTPTAPPRVTYFLTDTGAFDRHAGGIALKITDILNSQWMFKSVTAFRSYLDDPTNVDYTGLIVQRFGLSQRVEQNAFSQEFSLQGHSGPWSLTSGFIVTSDRFSFDRNSIEWPLALAQPLYNQAVTYLRTLDFGVYSQADYALTDKVKLTAGLRIYDTTQTGSNEYWDTNSSYVRTRNVYSAQNLSDEASGVSPRMALSEQFNPDTFGYASIARGEKFGGFNRAAASAIAAEYPTKPEDVTTLELGAKFRLFNGSTELNSALFYNDYRNYLAALTNERINGVLVADSVLVNAGRAQTHGIDLDLVSKLTARTSVTASLEFLGSGFKTFENPGGSSASNYVGNHLPYAPRISGSVALKHSKAVPGGTVEISAWAQYMSEQYSDVQNSQVGLTTSQVYLNLSASYFLANSGWTLSALIKNLDNRSYVLIRQQVPSLGIDAALYNPPRTAFLYARHDF